jgi:hypothetical protein
MGFPRKQPAPGENRGVRQRFTLVCSLTLASWSRAAGHAFDTPSARLPRRRAGVLPWRAALTQVGHTFGTPRRQAEGILRMALVIAWPVLDAAVVTCRRSNNSTRYELKCSGNSPT